MKLPQHRLRDQMAKGLHFRLKKVLIFFYLNSTRAAPVGGIYASLRQAAGNSNLKF